MSPCLPCLHNFAVGDSRRITNPVHEIDLGETFCGIDLERFQSFHLRVGTDSAQQGTQFKGAHFFLCLRGADGPLMSVERQARNAHCWATYQEIVRRRPRVGMRIAR